MWKKPPPTGWLSTQVLEWQRDRLRAAGVDPDQVADAPFRFMRLPEVEHLVGLHGSTIYRLVRKGKFPKPIPLTDRASSRLLENRPAA